MKVSPCYLFCRSLELCSAAEIEFVPPATKGIFVLYRHIENDLMELVYIGAGMGDQDGLKGQLQMHRNLQHHAWTHFSIFQVWENIPKKQMKELAGFFRHVYRNTGYAKSVMETHEYKPLTRIK